MPEAPTNRPPQLAEQFLDRILKDELKEEVLGDLFEKYQLYSESESVFKSKVKYWFQVLNYIRPFALRPFFSSKFNPTIMLQQNLKISWRSLKNNRGFAWINVLGLSLGLMAALLIGLWIKDELTYDRNIPEYERVALAMQNQTFGDEIRTWGSQAMQLAPALRANYGRYFDQVVTTSGTRDRLVTWGDKKLERPGNFMEPGIVDLLSLSMIDGSSTSLENPNSLLISEATAKAIFGTKDPMGELLTIQNSMEVTVQGIYEDLPINSSFGNLSFIAPWELLKSTNNYEGRLEWGNSWFSCYVKLKEGFSVEQVSEAIKNIKREHISKEYAERTNPEIFLHAMNKWHLHSDFENGTVIGGRIEYVRIFGLIGVFILLLACINFMNLSTAQSERRAIEVGVRKTIGSARKQLIGQFLSESFMVASISMLLAMLLSWLCLPFFNDLTLKEVAMPWSEPWFWLSSMLFLLTTTLISGSYPAFYLSGFNPLHALRATAKRAHTTFTLRRSLVTIQFIVSVSLIIGTIIIFKQIEHAKNRPIGYNQEQIVTVPLKTDEIMKHYETIEHQLLSSGSISKVAASDVTMTATYTTNSGFYWAGKDPNFSEEFYTLRATHGFGDLVGWHIKEGRDFSREFGGDSLSFILNETAVEYMNLKEPIGKEIQWGENAENGTYKVIGIIEDMITASPYEAVRPMIYILHYGRFISYLNFKINPNSSAQSALANIESVFEKYDPENIFEYQFMDESYARKFANEERLARLALFFAFMAIFISCIGLLGIAALTTEQRKKEIGIRKVLGASTRQLWSLITTEFFVLVCISFALSIPLAYYYMNNWLQTFVYRIELHWWIFALAGGIAILVTFFTVSFHTIRAAVSNPANALKTE